jgi:hypothetical protein
MLRIRHIWLVFAFALLTFGSGAAEPRGAGNQRQSDPAALLERLQRARLIRCEVYEGPRKAPREVSFTDGAQLQRVKAWIQRYAWPPIDPNTVGSVMPRVVFSVFEGADGKEPGFTIQVYCGASRAQPSPIHVSNDDWQKFISLMPTK